MQFLWSAARLAVSVIIMMVGRHVIDMSWWWSFLPLCLVSLLTPMLAMYFSASRNTVAHWFPAGCLCLFFCHLAVKMDAVTTCPWLMVFLPIFMLLPLAAVGAVRLGKADTTSFTLRPGSSRGVNIMSWLTPAMGLLAMSLASLFLGFHLKNESDPDSSSLGSTPWWSYFLVSLLFYMLSFVGAVALRLFEDPTVPWLVANPCLRLLGWNQESRPKIPMILGMFFLLLRLKGVFLQPWAVIFGYFWAGDIQLLFLFLMSPSMDSASDACSCMARMLTSSLASLSIEFPQTPTSHIILTVLPMLLALLVQLILVPTDENAPTTKTLKRKRGGSNTWTCWGFFYYLPETSEAITPFFSTLISLTLADDFKSATKSECVT